jgi:hypothetical protein
VLLSCVNRAQQHLSSRHINRCDENPTSTTPCKSTTSETLCHRDARKSFSTLPLRAGLARRIRSYAKCRVSLTSPSSFLKFSLNFFRLIATRPQFPHKTRPLFSWACALFHFPYGVTPLFATLTKTAGVYGVSSRSGTRPKTNGESRGTIYRALQLLDAWCSAIIPERIRIEE